MVALGGWVFLMGEVPLYPGALSLRLTSLDYPQLDKLVLRSHPVNLGTNTTKYLTKNPKNRLDFTRANRRAFPVSRTAQPPPHSPSPRPPPLLKRQHESSGASASTSLTSDAKKIPTIDWSVPERIVERFLYFGPLSLRTSLHLTRRRF